MSDQRMDDERMKNEGSSSDDENRSSTTGSISEECKCELLQNFLTSCGWTRGITDITETTIETQKNSVTTIKPARTMAPMLQDCETKVISGDSPINAKCFQIASAKLSNSRTLQPPPNVPKSHIPYHQRRRRNLLRLYRFQRRSVEG